MVLWRYPLNYLHNVIPVSLSACISPSLSTAHGLPRQASRSFALKRSTAGETSTDTDGSRVVKGEEEAAAATGVKVEGGGTYRRSDRQAHRQI